MLLVVSRQAIIRELQVGHVGNVRFVGEVGPDQQPDEEGKKDNQREERINAHLVSDALEIVFEHGCRALLVGG